MIGVGRVLADETEALLVDDERRHVRHAVVSRRAGTAAEVDRTAEARDVRADLHAHADAVAGVRADGEHNAVAQVEVLLRREALGHLLVLVDGRGAQDDALVRLRADGLAIANRLGADDRAVLGLNQLGDFSVELDLSALFLGVVENRLNEDAAGAGRAAALVDVDTVRHELILDVRDVAVTVQARPLDAAGVGQPLDMARRAVGEVGDQLFVHVVLARLDPQRGVLLGGIVLILGEFLLEAGARGLHDAAGEVGGAASDTGLFVDEDLRARCGSLSRGRYARAARADDQHVGLHVPRFLSDGVDRHDAHCGNAQRADGSALQKVSAGYVLHTIFLLSVHCLLVQYTCPYDTGIPRHASRIYHHFTQFIHIFRSIQPAASSDNAYY